MNATTDTIIIGGGQAGLAASRCLTALGHDHVVLEAGRVAERWHSQRWDSLRLLTPNWMTRLPEWSYQGPDPDGFMTAREVVTFFSQYAASFDAPVREHVAVRRLGWADPGFVVETTDGPMRAAEVIIATGWCDRPAVPGLATRLPSRVHQLAAADYRRPDDLPSGGVLVVGASATGVQLADELRRSGRDVTLAVGRHARMPRRYRGMDSYWWLDVTGSLDRTIDDVDDDIAARHEPSLQLVGRPDHSSLDLGTLQRDGVGLVGRLADVDGERVRFADGLVATVTAADSQLRRTLERIDAAIGRLGLTGEVLAPEHVPAIDVGDPRRDLDLRAAGIESVVWATGFRRPYEWLDLPIRERGGMIGQYRGVTAVPGAYVLGQRFQHFRSSNFIDGVGRDAAFVANHIVRRRASRPVADALLTN